MVRKLTCHGECWAGHRAQRPQVNDEDIRHAYANPIRLFAVDDGFVMLIGASAAAALLEIGVVEATTSPVVVHAMPAREKFLR